MNALDRERKKQEDAFVHFLHFSHVQFNFLFSDLIARSIPQFQHDVGGLLGAEFWRLPEYSHTLPLTLTKVRTSLIY